MNPHLRQTFATLARHRASGHYDRGKALRLLRNNARDTGATGADREALAREYLRQFERTGV